MATSGTVVFRPNRDQIITQALILCGVIDPENSAASPTAVQITNSSLILNTIVKQWETVGLELWERKYAIVFPQYAQGVFTLGNPGPSGDHACLTTPLGIGNFVQTTLSSAAVSSATSVVLTTITSNSSAGIPAVTVATAWNIGIQLDTGYIQWTTVNGAPSGTTCTLSAALTSAASAGNIVYAYQTKMMRPLRILDAFVRQVSGSDVAVNIIPRDNYNRFGLKTSMGTPTQLYYDPQENNGQIYLYPQFSQVNMQLYIEFQKPIEDFTSSTDDFDMPQEWALALIYNLALYLAPSYSVSSEKFKQIQYLADTAFKSLDGWDQEAASVFLQPSNAVYLGNGK